MCIAHSFQDCGMCIAHSFQDCGMCIAHSFLSLNGICINVAILHFMLECKEFQPT